MIGILYDDIYIYIAVYYYVNVDSIIVYYT